MIRNNLLRLALAALTTLASARQQPVDPPNFPCPEKLSFRVEWHGITAGTATVSLVRPRADGWQTTMDLESAGMVSRLYHVLDKYKVEMNGKFCGVSTELNSEEGKHRKYEKISFDPGQKKVFYYEHDFVKNQESRKEIESNVCTYEITGALLTLRNINLLPGKAITLPMTDGKKFANVHIEAQARENMTYAGKSYPTIRYEAFVFDNVLYKRKGRLQIWVTDDAARLPVAMRMQMGFPVGSINVALEKADKL
jgi:Protein of unknown function (DUF3108)